jgi:hypothetical protein
VQEQEEGEDHQARLRERATRDAELQPQAGIYHRCQLAEILAAKNKSGRKKNSKRPEKSAPEFFADI